MHDTRRKTLNITSSLLLGLFVLSGCSGAGTETPATDILAGGESTNITGEAVVSPVIDNTTGNFNPGTEESSTDLKEPDSATDTDTDTSTDTDNSISTSTDTNGPASNDEPTVVEIPDAILDTVRVHFDISVPAYASDALQVRLVWGDLDTHAIWVADESWTITENLQSNTENLLVITFSDDNGNTILGSYEADLSVGTSSPTTLSIAETDFDTSWDSDNDGMSNLDELLVGRNPLRDDSIHNEQLRTMFASRDTMFGEAIENIPNPDLFVNDELVSWRYDVINGQLVNNDRVTPLSHISVWERYKALTLPEHRTSISSIKFLAYTDNRDGSVVVLYNPTTIPGGTTTEPQFFEPMSAQIFTSEANNVAYPRSVSLLLMEMHASVLRGSQLITWQHEYDVPTYSLQPGSRVLWESWLSDFYRTFWATDVYGAWNSLRDDPAALQAMFPGLFVNDFAASGPSADFNASFRLFVQLNAMPTVDT
ncbi:hypothetical protein N9383_06265, partial [Granulosicoccus sp.]|nr:hypothetical protein [Granulosicoccus sp.]